LNQQVSRITIKSVTIITLTFELKADGNRRKKRKLEAKEIVNPKQLRKTTINLRQKKT
jgi:hypothetical protein